MLLYAPVLSLIGRVTCAAAKPKADHALAKLDQEPETASAAANRQSSDSAPFLPRIFRLEDRRVLDVSAAFSSATGQLELLLTNAAETAVVSVSAGNITITDSQQQIVDIVVDGAGPAPVNASVVDSIQVVGDAAVGQGLVLESPLALPKGFWVDPSIERAEIEADLTRVDQGPHSDRSFRHLAGRGHHHGRPRHFIRGGRCSWQIRSELLVAT